MGDMGDMGTMGDVELSEGMLIKSYRHHFILYINRDSNIVIKVISLTFKISQIFRERERETE